MVKEFASKGFDNSCYCNALTNKAAPNNQSHLWVFPVWLLLVCQLPVWLLVCVLLVWVLLLLVWLFLVWLLLVWLLRLEWFQLAL